MLQFKRDRVYSVTFVLAAKRKLRGQTPRSSDKQIKKSPCMLLAQGVPPMTYSPFAVECHAVLIRLIWLLLAL